MANEPNASAEKRTPSVMSSVIITSGQCTIGAVMNRSVVRPIDSSRASVTVRQRLVKSTSSKKFASIAAALAVQTILMEG